MSKLWDDLKDNMKDWSVTAVEKAEEMSKIAVAKTEEMTRISKVKFEIHQLHRELNKVYENLGKLAYEHTKNEHMASFSGNKDFFKLVNKIEDLKVEIEMKEKDINDIKEKFDHPDIEENKMTNTLNENSVVEESSEMQDNQRLEN
tara:strand:- start:1799 stop:2236 length:438 start_codon:yes stop_codon:yes gene_type:complete